MACLVRPTRRPPAALKTIPAPKEELFTKAIHVAQSPPSMKFWCLPPKPLLLTALGALLLTALGALRAPAPGAAPKMGRLDHDHVSSPASFRGSRPLGRRPPPLQASAPFLGGLCLGDQHLRAGGLISSPPPGFPPGNLFLGLAHPLMNRRLGRAPACRR